MKFGNTITPAGQHFHFNTQAFYIVAQGAIFEGANNGLTFVGGQIFDQGMYYFLGTANIQVINNLHYN
ncbi:MAG: hypothetical protein HC875_37005 [Anaerolineales bacterium]|nr:hypothetical protein [Anaerolineales bacterium]